MGVTIFSFAQLENRLLLVSYLCMAQKTGSCYYLGPLFLSSGQTSFLDISDSDAKQGLHIHACADEYDSGQSMLISLEIWIHSGKKYMSQ